MTWTIVCKTLEMIVGLLGILKAGCAYLPLDPGYPSERLSFMLADGNVEVLLTQRDALESKFELVETRKQQMNAMVNVYKALGGGWN